MGLISPIGKVKADVPVLPPINEEEESEEPIKPTYVKEDVFYFRGYCLLCCLHVQ